MLHLDVEVQSIQFYIGSQVGKCSIQLIDTITSKILESKIECKCKEIQQICEKVGFDIHYSENRQIKIIIHEGQAYFGEAIINLGFYIENNLPFVVDSIAIVNRFDQDAQIQVCLAWYQKDQQQYQIVSKTQTEKKFSQTESQEQLTAKQNIELLGKIDSIESPKKLKKTKQDIKSSSVSRETIINKLKPLEDEILKGSTKPKVHQKKMEFCEEDFNSRPTQNEQVLLLSCRVLDDDGIENNKLKIQNQTLQNTNSQLTIQVQKLTSENELLKTQLSRNEVAYKLLSEQYSNLRKEYEQVIIKGFGSCPSKLEIFGQQENYKKTISKLQNQIVFLQEELANSRKKEATPKEIRQQSEKLLPQTQKIQFCNIENNQNSIQKQQSQQENLRNQENHQRETPEIQKLLQDIKQENQKLIHQSKKDQVRLDSLQKELEITKRLGELSEQRYRTLEDEISQLERVIVNEKQSMADVLNGIMECGGRKFYDKIEKYMAYRKNIKIQ